MTAPELIDDGSILYESYIVPGRVENPDSDFYSYFYSTDPTLKIYFWNDTDGNLCKLTANHDIRTGNILGWYVSEDESCAYPDWTYA